MKFAISAIEGHLNAEVDPRFGRVAYFLSVDTDTMAVKAIRNPHEEALLGAGIQSALVAREGAEVVLTGECGGLKKCAIEYYLPILQQMQRSITLRGTE